MYTAQTKDLKATLAHMIEADRLPRTDRFAEASDDVIDAVLEQCGRFAAETLAPLNRAGDTDGSVISDGQVTTARGFREAYRLLGDGGWVGLAADPAYGGAGLPFTLQTAVNEMLSSACLSLSLCPLLSQGSIDALQAHGSDAQKALYLPHLASGRWTGTMNLTEPQAGTDVGAIRAKAEPAGDGTYRITGSKIWISWGDHDFGGNIVHLVLARLPDAPPGTRGISLFVAPKFLPGPNGELGARNAVTTVSLEHKLGLHGSPTCVMAFEGATGWLVDAPNKGMAAMFTMMNNARLGVGAQGVGVAEAATQKALAFALDRRQGRTPVGDGSGAIIDHADVRRMLAQMRSQTQAARAICMDCALHIDLAHAAETAEAREQALAMAAFLTPIAKAYGTDTGCEVAHLGVQAHGGAGFVEETGAAQFSRDVRVTAIYEGTNGVQAMDLVGRKMADGGETARTYLARIDAEAGALSRSDAPDLRALGAALTQALPSARRATDWMAAADMVDRGAGAVAYLRLLATLGGAMYLSRGARVSSDPARLALAQFFAATNLAQVSGLAAAACLGADAVYRLKPDALAS